AALVGPVAHGHVDVVGLNAHDHPLGRTGPIGLWLSPHRRGRVHRQIRAATRLRSGNWPRSWPQAAALSPPLLKRTVVANPAPLTMSRKRLMVSTSLVLRSAPSTGLWGMRFTWPCTPLSRLTSSLACSA